MPLKTLGRIPEVNQTRLNLPSSILLYIKELVYKHTTLAPLLSTSDKDSSGDFTA